MVGEERCYICNRTVSECKEYVREDVSKLYDKLIKSEWESIERDLKNQQERSRLHRNSSPPIDVISEWRRRNPPKDSVNKEPIIMGLEAYGRYVNWDSIRENGTKVLQKELAKLKMMLEPIEEGLKKDTMPPLTDHASISVLFLKLDDDFMSKYGSWNKKKYLAGVDFGHNFEDRDGKLLKTCFTIPDVNGTLAEIRANVEAYVSYLRKQVLDVNKKIKDMSIRPNLDNLKREFNDDILRWIRINTTKWVFDIEIPVCSLCSRIIDNRIPRDYYNQNW